MDISKRQLVHRLRWLGRGLGDSGGGAKTGSDTGEMAGSVQAPAPKKTTFLHQEYARANADVSEAYGAEDAGALKSHFERYGQGEKRGIRQENYINVEGVVACEGGHFFLSGWADRRLVKAMSVAIEVGYVRYDLGDIEVSWYFRADVSGQTGDTSRPSGFVALVQVPDAGMHSRVRVLINGKVVHDDDSMRWRSVDQFLTQTLNACAMLADQPVGGTLGAAAKLYDGFHALWLRYLEGLRFALAFEQGAGRKVRQSIVITLYRTADMLLPQLETLAATLAREEIEVVIVGNDLKGSPLVVDQLRGFCQIHDIALRLFLCSGNSGFSAGNNFGADMARGEVLIFMNPDIFPPERAPGEALAFLTRDPGQALHGALLYYGDGLLMHSGMYVASDLAVDARRGKSEPVLRVEHFGKGLSHFIDDESAAIEPVMADIRDRKLLVTAALWKIRKSLFEEMGGLSTDYLYAYYEDADFCMRMLEQGREITLDETARWIHMEGVGKANPPFVRSFMWLNRALFTRRFADSDLVAPDATDLFQL